MDIGRLDRRITIQQQSAVPDLWGDANPSWADLATVWATVKPLRGNEQFVAQQVNAEIQTKFTIRYRSDVTELMRIVYEGNNYDIHSIAELGRREGLEIIGAAVTAGD